MEGGQQEFAARGRDGLREGLRRPRPRLVNLSIDPTAPKAVSTDGPVALLPSPCAALSVRRMSPVEAYQAQVRGNAHGSSRSPRDSSDCVGQGGGGGGGGGGGDDAVETWRGGTCASAVAEEAPAAHPAQSGFRARKGRGLGLGLAVNLQLDMRDSVVRAAGA